MAIQTLTGTVISKNHLTEDVILLSLKIETELSFKAGQFVTIKIECNGETKLKSYSILNPPSQKGQLDFSIKLIEGGFASEAFKKTKVGDKFEIKGPFGHFIFDKESDSAEYWFLGAGTGVAPFYSMIKEFVTTIPEKKFVLLFGVRTKKSQFLDEDFRSLAQSHPNFRYLPVLSREEWEGLQGHVQDHLPEDCKNKTFYICGLKELVTETRELLIKEGVDPKNIKAERYT